MMYKRKMANLTYTIFNNTKPADFVTNLNTASGGVLGSFLLIIIFAIMFISLKQFELSKAFAASSFLTLFVAILFRIIGLIGDANLYFVMIVSGLAVFVLYLDK